MGRAPTSKSRTLPVSNVGFQKLRVTWAAPLPTPGGEGAAAGEESDCDILQDAESQMDSSDESDEDTRSGRSREQHLFLPTSNKRASQGTSTAISPRPAANRNVVDEQNHRKIESIKKKQHPCLDPPLFIRVTNLLTNIGIVHKDDAICRKTFTVFFRNTL